MIPILAAGSVPHILQHACVPHHGAQDAVAQLFELISSNNALLLISIDLSKAFDRVPRSILFSILHKYGITAKLWQAVVASYTNSHTRIAIGASLSALFTLLAGIKQGSVLSSLLFVIFINELLVALHTTGWGAPPAQQNSASPNVPVSAYMDDLVLTPATMHRPGPRPAETHIQPPHNFQLHPK